MNRLVKAQLAVERCVQQSLSPAFLPPDFEELWEQGKTEGRQILYVLPWPLPRLPVPSRLILFGKPLLAGEILK